MTMSRRFEVISEPPTNAMTATELRAAITVLLKLGSQSGIELHDSLRPITRHCTAFSPIGGWYLRHRWRLWFDA